MYKTAESVTPKHPDKICDQISDAILDECLRQDPKSRVAIETMGGHGIITITGELTTNATVDPNEIVKEVIKEKYGVQTNIVRQSPEIAQGVDIGGAGDQGIMIGYATNETKDLIPLELYLSRSLAKHLYKQYKFDGKTQITLKDGIIDSVVMSMQNVTAQVLELMLKSWEHKDLVKDGVRIYANPAGNWIYGGFDADTGLTGRKLAIDNYGPNIPLGGGCFSGKDATKVDRSAAYMARKIAVDYINKYGAKEVYCHLAYSIGIPEPVQAVVVVEGKEEVVKGYDLTPKGIIEFLNLGKPQFTETAKWGHFGNNFTWDK